MKSFQTLYNLAGTLGQNSKAETLTLFKQQINDTHRYLMQKYFFNEATVTIPTVSQQQFYALPFNYSKLKTATITIGNLKWNPKEVLTRREWDDLNVFPYFADIPNNFFIYNNTQIGIWPIPSTTGNIITFNYKIRVPELTFDDYITGTVAVTHNSTTVVGTATSWLTNYLATAGSVLNLNLWLKVTAPSGDNNWYQISSIQDATHLTLVNTYQGETVSGANYTIGQMPLLLEDFQDLLVYRPMELYFSTIQPDSSKYEQFKVLYEDGIKMMDDYVGTKSTNVNLARSAQMMNPNLFYQG